MKKIFEYKYHIVQVCDYCRCVKIEDFFTIFFLFFDIPSGPRSSV